MRTAADPLLGWKFGMTQHQLSPAHRWSRPSTRPDALKLGNIEAFSDQKFGLDIPKMVDDTLYADEDRAVKDKLIAVNINVAVYHVPDIAADPDAARKLFQFVTDLGAGTIATARTPANLDAVDKLANEFKLKVAICGAPDAVLAAVKSLSAPCSASAATPPTGRSRASSPPKKPPNSATASSFSTSATAAPARDVAAHPWHQVGLPALLGRPCITRKSSLRSSPSAAPPTISPPPSTPWTRPCGPL